MMKSIMIRIFLLSSIVAGYANAEQLSATIIGSGSPNFNKERASASVLVSNGETKILVDMGNGTQANLNELGVAVRDISSLFFTHHHLDHNEEFVPIFIGALMGRNDFTIVGPPNTKNLVDSNLELYKEDIEYRLDKTKRTLSERKKSFSVTEIKGGESFSVGDIRVSTIEVPHTIHTLAYRFDYNGESIVITGDLTYSKELPSLAENADFMIIDSGGMVMSNGRAMNRPANKEKTATGNTKKGKNGRVRAHLDLGDSSLLAKQSNVKNLVYTHFNTGTVDTESSLIEIRKNYTGNVIFGEDLMVLNNKTNQSKTIAKVNGYPIVDTGQKKFYSNNTTINAPDNGDSFFGQDASYLINEPSYTDNQDGTVTDNVTGLMWQQNLTEKLTYDDALALAKSVNLGGYNDWRVANIKELYSLIQFTGTVKGETAVTPFINTTYFTQPLGDTSQGEREIDAQVWSSTEYVGKTMQKDETIFGVNFVDGRIKGYPQYNPRTNEANKMYFRLVRGNESYGINNFVDNDDGTVSDVATGLMWQQTDSGKGLNWEEALAYAENLTLGGYDDWRLPNAKELQSIVDYTRSPETSNSAAIDPVFLISSIKNEAGEKDYPYYWSSTTHLDGPVPEGNGVYIAFGKALGEMRGTIMDVHGAGAQRSDPKTGEAMSRGPQGDMIRVDNYVRVVRGGVVEVATTESTEIVSAYNDTTIRSTAKNKEIKSGAKNNTASTNRFIARADKDKDGKVSRSEFRGNDSQFQHFDKNKDGYISVEEAPTGPPSKKK